MLFFGKRLRLFPIMSQELKAARKTRSDEAGPFSISRRFFESGPGSQNGKDAAALHVPFCHSLSLRKQELDELPRRSKAHGRGRGKCLQVIQPGSLEIWYYSWLPHPGKYGNLVLCSVQSAWLDIDGKQPQLPWVTNMTHASAVASQARVDFQEFQAVHHVRVQKSWLLLQNQ